MHTRRVEAAGGLLSALSPNGQQAPAQGAAPGNSARVLGGVAPAAPAGRAQMGDQRALDAKLHKLDHSLAGYEADELARALLDGLLGVLCNLGIGRQDLLHDAADVGDRQEAVRLPPAASLLPVRHRGPKELLTCDGTR